MNAKQISQFDIDISLFKNTSILDIASWSQIEIIFAISGKEADFEVFKFFLVGAMFFSAINKMMMKSMSSTSFLDKYMNNISTIEILYQFTLDNQSVRDSYQKWTSLAYLVDSDINCDDLAGIDIKMPYRALIEIGKKFPLVLLRFYDMHKVELHCRNKKFLDFLYKLMDMLRKKDSSLNKYFIAMVREFKNQRKIQIYLN